jgi:hypothetical protein
MLFQRPSASALTSKIPPFWKDPLRQMTLQKLQPNLYRNISNQMKMLLKLPPVHHYRALLQPAFIDCSVWIGRLFSSGLPGSVYLESDAPIIIEVGWDADWDRVPEYSRGYLAQSDSSHPPLQELQLPTILDLAPSHLCG